MRDRQRGSFYFQVAALVAAASMLFAMARSPRAQVPPTESFGAYIQNLAAATTPLQGSELFYVLQNGISSSVAFSAIFGSPTQGGAGPIQTSGAWTPTLAGDVTSGTVNYLLQSGSYEKNGRQVTVRFNINMNGLVPSGFTNYLQIAGLPFTAANVTNDHGVCNMSVFSTYFQLLGASYGAVLAGTNRIALASGGNLPGVGPNINNLGPNNQGQIIGICSYHT
jgi:hypothetical protein